MTIEGLAVHIAKVVVLWDYWCEREREKKREMRKDGDELWLGRQLKMGKENMFEKTVAIIY